MDQSKKTDKPQLDLDLEYTGNKTVERIKYKSRRAFVLLDQFAFWRSPLLWLVIYINGVFLYIGYLLYTNQEGIPPAIPLLFYTGDIESMLVPSYLLPLFAVLHIVGQSICIYVAAKNFYRLKQLSQFVLYAATMISVLFFIAMYKSFTVTLPVSP